MSIETEGVRVVSNGTGGWDAYVYNIGTGEEIKYVRKASLSVEGHELTTITLECHGTFDVSALPENVNVYIERSRWDPRRWIGNKYSTHRTE